MVNQCRGLRPTAFLWGVKHLLAAAAPINTAAVENPLSQRAAKFISQYRIQSEFKRPAAPPFYTHRSLQFSDYFPLRQFKNCSFAGPIAPCSKFRCDIAFLRDSHKHTRVQNEVQQLFSIRMSLCTFAAAGGVITVLPAARIALCVCFVIIVISPHWVCVQIPSSISKQCPSVSRRESDTQDPLCDGPPLDARRRKRVTFALCGRMKMRKRRIER